MKGLPLILTFALLGVNTPFSAPPKVPEPVTVVEDAAAWDALFSPEAFENVTYTSRTVVTTVEGYETISIQLRDGCAMESRYDEIDYTRTDENGSPVYLSGSRMRQEYQPENGMVLSYTDHYGDGDSSFAYHPYTLEEWNTMSGFYLEDQYAGRFDEAVYDKEDGCYHLTNDYTTASVYAEDGRVVKLTIGNAAYQTESRFTDYGTTAIEPIPMRNSAVTKDQWAFAFSGEGLKNHVVDTAVHHSAGDYGTVLLLGSRTATLEVYGDPIKEMYGYKSTEEGVSTFLYQDYYWVLSSQNPQITWEDAIHKFTGLDGLADAFDSAVYDEASGCYTLTLNRLGEDETYTVFFADGELSYIRMESESVTSSTVFSRFTDNFDEEDWIPASAYAAN